MYRIALCFGLLVAASPAAAHNGAVAVAVPVDNIVLDGNFADWPVEAQVYPVALPGGGPAVADAADFSCTARFGYDSGANALYVAVDITDNEVVIDTSVSATWSNQEHFLLAVDPSHAQTNKEFSAYQLLGDTYTMDPFGDEPRRSSDAQVERGTAPGRRRYEWRLDIDAISGGQVRLQPHLVVGLNIAVTDHDADGARSDVKWGPGYFTKSLGMGDLLLAPAAPAWGRLAGRATWEGGAPFTRGKVDIQSLGDAGLRLRKAADRQGNWAVSLPPGSYAVQALGVSDTVDITAGGEKEIALTVPAPVGEIGGTGPGISAVAGSGRVRLAGAGTQGGKWRTFGVADGLPAATVQVLYRDRRGPLWIGTQGAGAVRYDGAEFVQFDPGDGLAHNDISAMVQDSEDNLWFATAGGGISRYDGATFRTFTAADGLASDTTYALAIDGRGHIWVGTKEGVSRYDGETFRTFAAAAGLAASPVVDMTVDSHGDLWFITRDEDVVRYDGARFIYYTGADGLDGLWGIRVARDGAGGLLFSLSQGIKRLSGETLTPLMPGGLIMSPGPIQADSHGRIWVSAGNTVRRYDGQQSVQFTTVDGLAEERITALVDDGQGGVWCGHYGGGLSYYQAERLRTFTTDDGLTSNRVFDALEDRRGRVWAGSHALDLLNGERFGLYEGLVGIRGLMEDSAGNLWIGANVGAFRYDGKRVEEVALKGSSDLGVKRILEDSAGRIWFTSVLGAICFDGETSTDFTTDDGLASDFVRYILEDGQGQLWFATDQGLSRYDGKRLVNFTQQDGLASNAVYCILEDVRGRLWFGTDAGLSRYDGSAWRTFSTADGLSHDQIAGLHEDPQGRLWVATWGGGVNVFDGAVFQHMLRADGLGSNVVQNITQAAGGELWISTHGGLTRYRPAAEPPRVRLTNITSDRKHGPIASLRLSTAQDYLLVEFQGASFTTAADRLAYVYRLAGLDTSWQVTRQPRVEYADLGLGEYAFEVKAVDQDLNYSAPATLLLSVQPPYQQWALYGLAGLGLIGFVLASGVAVRRGRAYVRAQQDRQAAQEALNREQEARLAAQEALNRELEDELQTASQLQRALMPTAAPSVAGFALAGRCVPANHVSGDFFQYFERPGGRLALCLADVTDHGMDAAIPMVQFSGVLDTAMQYEPELEELYSRLNGLLYKMLERRKFVCFTLAELQPTTRTVQLANAGCPFPFHFQAASGQLVECQVAAFPLGARLDPVFPSIEVGLQPGDRLVLCSDGIIEAANTGDELFGFERTAAVIQQGCAEGLEAEALLDRLLQRVRTFAGGRSQEDDQTVVVLQVEG